MTSDGAAGAGARAAKKGMSCGIIALIVVACAVPILGVLAALGIYGVRRYLTSAKTAEAKSTIGAIGRSGSAAYERDRALCASQGPDAPGHGPVPRSVQSVSGTKYMPSTAPGTDFNTGGPRGGWMCLKFSVSQPMYYQYSYAQGSGYLHESPAAGPTGFEAAAVGDVDADGVRSVFARHGRVDASGQLVMATQIWIDNEFE